MPKPTTLGYALLGLLHFEPQSGYALRQFFASSPMGMYSSSPGAIYPALKSLQRAGLVQKSLLLDSTQTKGVFEVTSQGESALFDWLRSPVTYEDVERRESELILRFSMMTNRLQPDEIIEFLQSLEEKTMQLHNYVVAYLDENRSLLGDVPSAAVQYGIDLIHTRSEWARRTRNELKKTSKKSRSK